ncbi:MAG: transglycosylase domain-containing protein, partial [Candidatus Sungiibacteriota bacterium]
MRRPSFPHAHHTKSRTRAFFILAIFFVLLFLGGAASVYSLVRDMPNPSRVGERSVIESTKIYDRTGTIVLYEIHGNQRRSVIPFDQIPDSVKKATLAAEDINFYRHIGIDWRGIARAIVTNITRGNFSQGGSTITQQFVKNSLLGPEKTLTRKIREQILSLLLERNYSKDEIFGFYLNQIPYGANTYGISAAAEYYFNKKPADLTLAEGAALASLPKAPTYYSPYGPRKKELLQRKDWTLDRMADAGLIARADVDAAKLEALVFAPPREAIRAPHFVEYVRDYLNKKYGEQTVEQGGLKVTTTLDWTLQEEAEKIIREGAEANEKLVGASNAALVAIDPQSGDILALVGSRDYLAESLPKGCTAGITCTFDPYVNIATASRQPGSAFKPFVYATAFKKGYTPETVLFDVATEFNPLCNPDGSPGAGVRDPKQCYHPQDYDGTFRGPVSMRQAIAQSLNVPAVKVLYLAGIPDSIATAQTMGITTLTQPDRYGLSLVLGGAEVTLLD